jgi:hypothetical protein
MKKLKTYTKFNENFSDYQIDQFGEDKSFISDTLLELQESGFQTRISIDGVSSQLSVADPMPVLTIGCPGHGSRSGKYFKFQDVKDELLQIKSYLGDRWFKCGVLFENDPKRIEVYIDEKDYDYLDDWFQTSTTGIVNLAVFFNI